MDAETRRRAKAINFGIIYGISAFGLAQRSLGYRKARPPSYIKRYFARFPGIRDYMERIEAIRARERLCRDHLRPPRAHHRNQGREPGACAASPSAQAINAPLQGSAADIIKRAMKRIPPALAAAGLKTRMLLQVHDELVFEAPDREVDAVKKLAKECDGKRLRAGLEPIGAAGGRNRRRGELEEAH